MNYRIIPIFLVKSFERCIVTWTAAIVARDLNTAIPRIDFIRQCNDPADLHFDGNLLGLCTKGGEQIYVLRDMRPGELAKTTAHEVRHVWQKRKPDGYRADRERDARIYEREFWWLKLGDPSDDMVIRSLADACVELRSSEEARMKVVREKLDWQEKLLKNLQQQKDASRSQMLRLAESIAATKADLREGEKVLRDTAELG